MHDDSERDKRALGGDRKAFDSLVVLYRATAYRQAIRRVRDPNPDRPGFLYRRLIRL